MSKADYSRREFLQRSAGIAGASLFGRSILLEPEPLIALPRLNAASDKVIEWASVNAVTTLTMLPKAGAASGTASHRFSRRSRTAGSNRDNRNSR